MKIKSLSDFLKKLNKIKYKKDFQTNLTNSRFFRGQSDWDWNCSPGIYRDKFFDKERILVNETLHRFPNEFDGMDKFSTLVKMQHFGLKTRLLDVTENPLVGLYFACSENAEKAGSLFVFNNVPTHYSTDLLVEIYMNFIFKFSGDSIEENEILHFFQNLESENLSRRKIKNIEDLLYDLNLPGIFVTAKTNNIRLMSQSGAFYIPGMNYKKEYSQNPGTYGKSYYKFFPKDIDESNFNQNNYYKYIIPAEYKKRIIGELNELNINKSTLFPDISNQLPHINSLVLTK